MHVPTEEDWRSEAWGIDTLHAYENFSGRNLRQAEDLFVNNSFRHQEDIMFMPNACFKFYVLAYVNYLKSKQSRGDSDGASCFFGIVEVRQGDIRNSDESLKNTIVDTLRYLAIKQTWFDASIEIYGNFETKAQDAIEKIGRG